jgi:hypothetical protein
MGGRKSHRTLGVGLAASSRSVAPGLTTRCTELNDSAFRQILPKVTDVKYCCRCNQLQGKARLTLQFYDSKASLRGGITRKDA